MVLAGSACRRSPARRSPIPSTKSLSVTEPTATRTRTSRMSVDVASVLHPTVTTATTVRSSSRRSRRTRSGATSFPRSTSDPASSTRARTGRPTGQAILANELHRARHDDHLDDHHHDHDAARPRRPPPRRRLTDDDDHHHVDPPGVTRRRTTTTDTDELHPSRSAAWARPDPARRRRERRAGDRERNPARSPGHRSLMLLGVGAALIASGIGLDRPPPPLGPTRELRVRRGR